MLHIALDRPRPDDGDLHDWSLNVVSLSRGSMIICARLSIGNVPSVSARPIMKTFTHNQPTHDCGSRMISDCRLIPMSARRRTMTSFGLRKN